MPGDVIPSKVICDEHHDVGRLARDDDAADQDEEGGEQHGGQSGQLQCVLANWPDSRPYLQTGWQTTCLCCASSKLSDKSSSQGMVNL